MSMNLEVVPYRSEWQEQFLDLGRRIRAAMQSSALRIDHIGSTAVQGLSAKPIIDVQLTVASLAGQVMLTEQLAPLGLVARGETREDRPPPWDVAEPREWQKFYYRTKDGIYPRVHLHVRASGRRNQRYPILFRDYLRANSRARDAYGLFKQNLARFVGHLSNPGGTGPYLDMKDPVLDLIAESAERWAEITSWRPGASDA
jgi:GrpB-like predicted nucleotidyltransferase (UPF0157 family)